MKIRTSTMSGKLSRFEQSDDLVVMKFGGTSVEDAAAIRRVITIVQSRGNAHPVLVVSALARVTDQLLEAGNSAANGHLGSALASVRNIYVRHEQLADELAEGGRDGELDRELRCAFRALESLLHELGVVRRFDLAAQDHLLGFGERFSSKLVTAALRATSLDAAYVDAGKCIITDARHGQASPVWEGTNQRLQEVLTPLLEAGHIPVLGGFIASTCDGVPTTLGRGGSDFTAAIVGAALGAARIEIWTDVDGVMTADPKLCPEARVIRKMSFEEAAVLAQCGAKVLHPATLAPAMRENISVYVLNSRRPEGEGTEIVARARSGSGIRAVIAKRNVSIVEIKSQRGSDAELLHAVLAAFEQHACPVDMLGCSLGHLSLLVSSSFVNSSGTMPGVAAALEGVAEVRWENHKALVCVVGEGIRREPDVSARILAALSDMEARVMWQAASDRTITLLVEESKVEPSVRRLHANLFPDPESTRDWGGISAAFCQAG
jgi:aspartate kinase